MIIQIKDLGILVVQTLIFFIVAPLFDLNDSNAQSNQEVHRVTSVEIEAVKGLIQMINQSSSEEIWHSDEFVKYADQAFNKINVCQSKVTLFSDRFSPKTGGYFKPVSNSLIDCLNDNHAHLITISHILLKAPRFRQKAYRLVLAYQLIERQKAWLNESNLYFYSMKNDPFFEAIPFLRLRFQFLVDQSLQFLKTSSHSLAKSVQKIMSSKDSSVFLNEIGFWLRREIDQSKVGLYQFLMMILAENEKDFLSFIQQIDLPTFLSKLSPKEQNSLFLPLMKRVDSGLYIGDLQGLLANEGLGEGITQLLGEPFQAIGYRNLWYKLSGFHVEKPLDEHEKKRPFLFLNPQFIFWGIDHLLPQLSDKGMQDKLQELYHKRFSRLGHLLIDSYLYLKQNTNLAEERMEYSLARLSTKFEERDYLSKRYAKVLKDKYPKRGQEVFTPSKAIGFWLKREIDGSALMIWGGLLRFLHVLDPSFVKNL